MAEIPKRKGTWVSNVVKRIDASGLNADTTRERRVAIPVMLVAPAIGCHTLSAVAFVPLLGGTA